MEKKRDFYEDFQNISLLNKNGDQDNQKKKKFFNYHNLK